MGILNDEDHAIHSEAVTQAKLAKQAADRRRAEEAERKRVAEAEALHAAVLDLVGNLVDEVKKNFRNGKEPSASVHCYRDGILSSRKMIADAFYRLDGYRDADKADRKDLIDHINSIVALYDTDFVATVTIDRDGVYDPKDGLVGHTFAAAVITLAQKKSDKS